MDNLKEEWVVFGPIGEYRVSNMGRVQSRLLPGSIKHKNRLGEWRDLKPAKARTDKHGGYYWVVASKAPCGKFQPQRIHRLVVEHFIRKPQNGEHVNHIDGNRDNNRLNNLEIVSPKENIRNARERGALSKTRLSGVIDEFKLLSIITMVNAGRSNSSIAAHYGIDPGNISKLRHCRDGLYSGFHYLVDNPLKFKGHGL